MGINKPCKE
jgi:hypothetical protein